MSTSGSKDMSRRHVLGALAALPTLPILPVLFGASVARADDAPPPLPSWNDGPAKQAILDFVRATTDPSSPNFVPPEERIATFDQDGTLWVEHPIYTQVIFCLDRVPALAEAKPGSGKGRAVQDGALRRPREDRQAFAAGLRDDRRRDPHRHGRGGVSRPK